MTIWQANAYCFMALDGIALLTMAISFAIIRAEDPQYRALFPGALITIAGAAYAMQAFYLFGDWMPGKTFPWARLVGDVAIAVIAVRRVVYVLKSNAAIRRRLNAVMPPRRGRWFPTSAVHD